MSDPNGNYQAAITPVPESFQQFDVNDGQTPRITLLAGRDPFGNYEVESNEFTQSDINNGFDPVLGPPYPPVEYQFFGRNPSSPANPRLYWTQPVLTYAYNMIVTHWPPGGQQPLTPPAMWVSATNDASAAVQASPFQWLDPAKSRYVWATEVDITFNPPGATVFPPQGSGAAAPANFIGRIGCIFNPAQPNGPGTVVFTTWDNVVYP